MIFENTANQLETLGNGTVCTRSAVERVNGYLKCYFPLNKTNYFKAPHVVIELLLIQLAHNPNCLPHNACIQENR
jgi:hypothetical protein